MTEAGVIDFTAEEGRLLLQQAALMLQEGEEADFYCDVSGVHYALNCERGPTTPEFGERLAVLISEIRPRKNKRATPDLYCLCVLWADDGGNMVFAPYQADDEKLSSQAKAVMRSIARALEITLP